MDSRGRKLALLFVAATVAFGLALFGIACQEEEEEGEATAPPRRTMRAGEPPKHKGGTPCVGIG